MISQITIVTIGVVPAVTGIIAGVALLGVACEMAARRWLRRKEYRVFAPGRRVEMELDPGVFPGFESKVRIQINREGERGGEVRRDTEGVYRILIIGGSVVESYVLDQGTCWPGRLERMLNESENLAVLDTARVHVGSIGRSGFGAQFVNQVFEKILPRYGQLDAILIQAGMSNAIHWLERSTPEKMERRVPVPTDELFAQHPEQRFGWKPRALALTEVLRRVRDRLLIERHPGKTGKTLEAWRAMRQRAAEVRETVPDPAPMLKHFEVNFREAIEQAKSHARRVVIVQQTWWDRPPTAEEDRTIWVGAAGQPWREEVKVYYRFELLGRLMETIDAKTREIAEELGVEYVELMGLVQPGLADYYDGLHYTREGSAKVAEAVSEQLLGTSKGMKARAKTA